MFSRPGTTRYMKYTSYLYRYIQLAHCLPLSNIEVQIKPSPTEIPMLTLQVPLSYMSMDLIWSKLSLYLPQHYSDVIMGTMVFQITSLMIVNSTIYSGKDQRKHQSSPSLALVRGIHRWPVNSPHKWPVTQKMFPFDDVIMAHYGAGSYTDLGPTTKLVGSFQFLRPLDYFT